MNIIYELYVRFMVWLGATPPEEYDYLLPNQQPIKFPFEERIVTSNNVNRSLNPLFSGFLVILGVTVLLIWIGRSDFAPDWTGLGETVRPIDPNIIHQPAKTLWDWMELLIIPTALFVLGFWFNSTVRNNERQTEQDRLQENALQSYFDQMAELLLEKSLRHGSDLGDEVRDIARVRTLTTLERLDGVRKGILLRFLHEAELINVNKAVISLTEANLRGMSLYRGFLMEANLSFTDLDNANLSEADLFRADLHGVMLTNGNLRKVNLEGASLNRANLRKSNLSEANLRRIQLVGANLSEANLTNANLQEAGLIRANLEKASLRNADLTGAYLYDSSLSCADLRGANLQGCILYQVDLSKVDFSNADLRRVDFSRSQHIRQASFNGIRFDSDTKWPDGFHPTQELSRKMPINRNQKPVGQVETTIKEINLSTSK